MSPTISLLLQQKQSTSQHKKMLVLLQKSITQKNAKDNTNSVSKKHNEAKNIKKNEEKLGVT